MLLYTVREKGGKSERKPHPLPYGLRNPYRDIKPENSQDEGWVGGEVSKYKNTPVSSTAAVERFFQSPPFFLLMTTDDSPLLGQSVSELNFYDDGRHSLTFSPLLAD